jgi:hypothetical protein
MPGKKSIDFDRYPNQYPETDRNCFDCLNLKMKLKVNQKGRMLFSKTNYAACKENFILRSYHGNNIDIHEPRFAITGSVWSKIDSGWRHLDWSVAGACPHFNDMREDHDSAKTSGANLLLNSHGKGLPGIEQAVGGNRVSMGTAPLRDEILQGGEGEGAVLPEEQGVQG